jgi:hypothetical protein
MLVIEIEMNVGNFTEIFLGKGRDILGMVSLQNVLIWKLYSQCSTAQTLEGLAIAQHLMLVLHSI